MSSGPAAPPPEPSTGTSRLEALLDQLPALADVRQHQASRLMLAGVAIGATAGVAAGAFDHLIVLLSELMLGTAEPSISRPSSWAMVLAPVFTGLVATTMVLRLTRNARAQGIPDVLARVQLRHHPLSIRDALVSAGAAALVIGGGQSGGREGPIVQLAASVAGKIVSWLGVPASRARALVAAGAAAAVAASFNTPIAGAFFALEIILGNFAMETFAPVIAATVTGTVVGQALLGDRIALHLPPFSVQNFAEYGLYVVLGLLCGAVGAGFKRALHTASDLMHRAKISDGMRGAAAGAVVALIAVGGMSQVMGNGYSFMEELISHAESYGILLLAVLLVAKVVATAATTAGRAGAGLFAPSLFVGAVTGTLFGETMHLLLPTVVEDAGAYGMVGMAAVAAATLHAPITMTLMLFEMTRNYAVVLPLLVSVATASVMSRYLTRESIYEAELRHQGLELTAGREALVMHDLTVGDVMREEGFETISATAQVGEVVARFLARRTDAVFAISAEGKLVGVFDIQDAKRFFAHPDQPGSTLAPRRVATLRPDQRVSDAIGVFFGATLDELAVVTAEGVLVGVLTERDVVAAYNREVLRRAAPLARVVHEGPEGRRTDFLELPEGEVMEVVHVRAWMAGKSLRELDLTGAYGSVVVAVRNPGKLTGVATRRAPQPDEALAADDELILIGPADRVAALEAVVAAPVGDQPAQA